ncbi:MAG: hypothetical protein HZC37_18925 [Burkholderiales bacterium]|nr:hypothetical protein [Burkholderiales bacterium]
MQKTRRAILGTTALAVLAAAASLVPRAVRAQADLLDGKVFVTTEGERGKPADVDNVLTFSGGKFHSKACDQWGYDKGTVKATRAGDAIHFETETRSEKYETRQVWKGVIKGDTIEGTKTVYRKPSFFRPNPDPIEGWFKGALKP